MVFARWRRWRRVRPQVEQLEERALPSTALPSFVLMLRPGTDRPMQASTPDGEGYTPAQIAHAYHFDQTGFDGTGQTIAVIDAFDNPQFVDSTDPNFAKSDLHQFDLAFGLPDPPSFTKVDQTGGTNYPKVNASWASETALDVEWAHALAPGANILLIEANDDSFANLDTAAVAFARKQSEVTVVSMSFGVPEDPSDFQTDPLFRTPKGHAGITFVAPTGDSGAPATYPAFSPNVLAVGGTTLHLDAAGNFVSESAWHDSGGGISAVEPLPSYQAGVAGSNTRRLVPDVAFDANPDTGVPVYDSYNNGAQTPWDEIGGTSFATPAWAALIALADEARAQVGQSSLDGRTQTLPMLYRLPQGDFHDITTGSNNRYFAHAGYDVVTGRGSPISDLIVPGLIGPPAISSLSMPSAQEGSPDQALTVNGSGFNTGSVVYLNGTALATSFISATQLQITIPATDLVEEGTFKLEVINPAGTGAGPSNVVSFPVTEAPLSPDPGVSLTATEGIALTNVQVAGFTDPDANDGPANYQATITWGDGTAPTVGTVTAQGGGQFAVSGTHTYREDGTYSVAVRVMHANAPTVVVQDTAAVAEAALSGGGVSFSPVEGRAFGGTVATFTDADPTKPATAYAAIVSWGDGSAATAGTIVALGGALFGVAAGHTYAEEGTDAITVTIKHAGAPPLTLTGQATVTDAILTSTGKYVAVPGTSLTAVLATLTDADPKGTLADYTATIDWGDGTAATTGTVSVSSTGGFTVTGTHAYAATGVYHDRITVQDAGGSTTLAAGVVAAGVALPARQESFVVGADAGNLPEVAVFDETGHLLLSFLAYSSTFLGGVRVATGVRNGTPVIVTAPGPGMASVVKLFNENTGQQLARIPVFGGTSPGGLSVALGDVNGDGVPDLVVGQGGGGGQVAVFDGNTLLTTPTLLGAAFTPFDPVPAGGVTVAVGGGELVVGAGSGGAPLVNICTFDGTAFVARKSFDAFDPSFAGGVFVTVGDFNGDGTADVIVGSGPGGPAQVNVYDGSQLGLDTSTPPVLLTDFTAYGGAYQGGVRVAAITAPDGQVGIWTAPGKGDPNHDLRTAFFLSGTPVVFDRIALGSVFAGGMFIG